MMSKSILVFLFAFCSCLLFQNKIIAQCSSHSTVVSPPLEGRTDPTDGATAKSVICNGQPLTLVTTSLADCPACTYLWSDGTTGPYLFAYTPGVYSVTVTDNAPNGCVGVSSDLTITATNLAKPQIAGDSFNICLEVDNSVKSRPNLLVDNPCATCTYKWYKNTPSILSLIHI